MARFRAGSLDGICLWHRQKHRETLWNAVEMCQLAIALVIYPYIYTLTCVYDTSGMVLNHPTRFETFVYKKKKKKNHPLSLQKKKGTNSFQLRARHGRVETEPCLYNYCVTIQFCHSHKNHPFLRNTQDAPKKKTIIFLCFFK